MVTKHPNADDETFFDQIGSRQGSGWCSPALILAISIVVLVIGAVVIWIVARPYHAVPGAASLSALNLPGIHSLPNGNLVPSDGEYTVHLRDDELNTTLASLHTSSIEDLHGAIHASGITLEGSLTSPLKLPIVIKFTPKVQDGKITIEVDDVTITGVRALPLATTALREQLARELTTLIQSKFSGKITRITLEEGQLTAFLTP